MARFVIFKWQFSKGSALHEAKLARPVFLPDVQTASEVFKAPDRETGILDYISRSDYYESKYTENES